jgi:hypothetical protein
MPPKRAKKAHHSKAILNAPRDDEPIYPISLPSPLLPSLDCLPSLDPPDEPEPTIEPTIDADKPPQQEKVAAIKWTIEMIEALVECIYGVWKDGRAIDNGFKKEAWVEASIAITWVYRGLMAIEWDKCKNKWIDLKEKWKH